MGCGYIVYSNKDDGKVSEDKLNGIRVNRELKVEKRIDEDKIEECRLSSQMVVTDKFISNNSSEGFYLYLWKDNVTESALDIYMRVEFNHAKYGRIIPFTMPYSNGSITSFQKIAEECTHIENGVLINDGFSLEDYRRYSYIHFKYLKSDEHGYVYVNTDGLQIFPRDPITHIDLFDGCEYKVSDLIRDLNTLDTAHAQCTHSFNVISTAFMYAISSRSTKTKFNTNVKIIGKE